MPITVKLPNGKTAQFPDGMPSGEIEAVLARQFPTPEPRTRTLGETATDIAASVGSGVGSLVQFPGQLLALTGAAEPDNFITKAGEGLSKFASSFKSDPLKQREQIAQQKLAAVEGKGVAPEIIEAIKAYGGDPALLTSFVAEQAPQLLGSLGLGKAAQLGTKALVKDASEELLKKAGTRGAIGAGAVMQGSDVGMEQYERAYKTLVAQGVSPDQAKDEALNLARATGAGAAIISLLVQRLPGASTLEKSAFGQKIEGSLLPRVTKTALGEGFSEGLEEGGGKLAANIAQQVIDPNQLLTAGVGTAGGLGFIGGAGLGGIGGALGGRPDEQAQRAPAETVTTPDEQRRLLFQKAQQAAVEEVESKKAEKAKEAELRAVQREIKDNIKLWDSFQLEQAKAQEKQLLEEVAASKEASQLARQKRADDLRQAFPADYGNILDLNQLEQELNFLESQPGRDLKRIGQVRKQLNKLYLENPTVAAIVEQERLAKGESQVPPWVELAGKSAEKSAEILAGKQPIQMEMNFGDMEQAIPEPTLRVKGPTTPEEDEDNRPLPVLDKDYFASIGLNKQAGIAARAIRPDASKGITEYAGGLGGLDLNDPNDFARATQLIQGKVMGNELLKAPTKAAMQALLKLNPALGQQSLNLLGMQPPSRTFPKKVRAPKETGPTPLDKFYEQAKQSVRTEGDYDTPITLPDLVAQIDRLGLATPNLANAWFGAKNFAGTKLGDIVGKTPRELAQSGVIVRSGALAKALDSLMPPEPTPEQRKLEERKQKGREAAQAATKANKDILAAAGELELLNKIAAIQEQLIAAQGDGNVEMAAIFEQMLKDSQAALQNLRGGQDATRTEIPANEPAGGAGTEAGDGTDQQAPGELSDGQGTIRDVSGDGDGRGANIPEGGDGTGDGVGGRGADAGQDNGGGQQGDEAITPQAFWDEEAEYRRKENADKGQNIYQPTWADLSAEEQALFQDLGGTGEAIDTVLRSHRARLIAEGKTPQSLVAQPEAPKKRVRRTKEQIVADQKAKQEATAAEEKRKAEEKAARIEANKKAKAEEQAKLEREKTEAEKAREERKKQNELATENERKRKAEEYWNKATGKQPNKAFSTLSEESKQRWYDLYKNKNRTYETVNTVLQQDREAKLNEVIAKDLKEQGEARSKLTLGGKFNPSKVMFAMQEADTRGMKAIDDENLKNALIAAGLATPVKLTQKGSDFLWNQLSKQDSTDAAQALVDEVIGEYAPVEAPTEAEAKAEETKPTYPQKAIEDFFKPELLKSTEPDYKSDEKIVYMKIDDFLSVANFMGKEDSQKARESAKQGIKWDSLPRINMIRTKDKNTRRVGEHNGRHRALVMKEAGFDVMPVLLVDPVIRWDQQDNPDKFDYEKDWPVYLQAQTQAKNPNTKIRFPVPNRIIADRKAFMPDQLERMFGTDPEFDPIASAIEAAYTAFDQVGEYKDIDEAIESYRVNVGDTMAEKGIKDDSIIQRAIEEFDVRVKELRAEQEAKDKAKAEAEAKAKAEAEAKAKAEAEAAKPKWDDKLPSREKYESENKNDKYAPSYDEAVEVQKAIYGKSMIEVAQWLADTSPNKTYRMIAEKVVKALRGMEAAGIELKPIKVGHIGDNSRSAGARALSFWRIAENETPFWEVEVKGADVSRNVGMTRENVLHELVHVVTQGAIFVGRQGNAATRAPKSDKLVNDLIAVMNRAVRYYRDAKAGKVPMIDGMDTLVKETNAFAKLDEMVTWGLTNPTMQKILEAIPYKSDNAWTRFVSSIREFLGMPVQADTALAEVLKVSEALIDVPASEYMDIFTSDYKAKAGKNEVVAGAKPAESQFSQYSRSGTQARGMPVKQIEQFLKSTQTDRMVKRPKVVVATIEQLKRDYPKFYNELMRETNGNGKGAYNKGLNTVFIVADNADSEQDVAMTFLHEVTGHFGLQSILGKDYARVMRMALQNKKVAELAQKHLKAGASPELAAEEALAEMAEADTIPAPARPVMRAIKAAIRNAARYLFGKDIALTDNDVKDLLIESRRYVYEGKKSLYRREAVQQIASKTVFRNPIDEVESITAQPVRMVQQKSRPTAIDRVKGIVDEAKNIGPKAFASETIKSVPGKITAFRTLAVDNLATVEQRLINAYSKGFRDSFGNINPIAFARQAMDAPRLAADFFKSGKIVLDNDGMVRTKEGEYNFESVLKDLKKLADKWGKSYEETEGAFNTMLEAKRIKSLYAENAKREKNIQDLIAAGRKEDARRLEEKRPQLRLHMSEDMADELSDAFDNTPEFVALRDQLNTIRESVLALARDSGVIDEEMYKDWVENGDYVPFDRLIDWENGEYDAYSKKAIARGLAAFPKAKQFRGSYDRPVNNIMDNYARTMEWMISRAVRNHASNALLNDMTALNFARPLKDPKQATIKNLVVHTFVGGKDTYHEVASEYDMMAFGAYPLARGPLVQMLAKTTRVLRSSITLLPPFAVNQVLQDAQRAAIMSGTAKPLRVIGKTLMRFPQIALYEYSGKFKPESYDALARAGVVGDFDFNAEKAAQEVRYNTGIQKRAPWARFINLAEKFTKASDLAARMAVYEQIKEEFGDTGRAEYAARELINFKRRGSSAIISNLIPTVPFFNAYAQGMDVMYRQFFMPGATASGAEKSLARAAMLRTSMMIMGLSLMYALMMSDEPEYMKAENYVRDRNFLLPGGFKIPVPNEFGVVLKSSVEAAVNYYRVLGTDEERSALGAIKEYLTQLGSAVASPNVISPWPRMVVEQFTNFDFFTGRDIDPERGSQKEPALRYGPNTSELAKAIGELTNVSPYRIDHVMRGILGTTYSTGTLLVDGMLNPNLPDRPIHKMPFLDILMFRPEGTRTKSLTYELLREAETAHATFEAMLKDDPDAAEKYLAEKGDVLAMRDYLKFTIDQLSFMRSEKNMIINAKNEDIGMDGKEKRQRITEIEATENELTKEIAVIRKAMKLN